MKLDLVFEGAPCTGNRLVFGVRITLQRLGIHITEQFAF
jgi:hypothetical protein